MRRLILVIVLLTTMKFMYSQQLPFPRSSRSDSISLLKTMPLLARQVLAQYKNESREAYLDNSFRINIVAENYELSVKKLDSLLVMYNVEKDPGMKRVGFQFRTYSLTKLKQQNSGGTFPEVFEQVLKEQYAALPFKAQEGVLSYFENDIASLREKFYQQLSQYSNKDSISLAEATSLCRAYNSYIVYQQVSSPGKKILLAIDKQFYIIEDSVLIKTRDGATIAATVVRKRGMDQPLPAIFTFNIYSGDYDKSRAKAAANNGYVGVVANTRGKRLSPDIIEPFEHDANDGYDIIDWISKQPWCNGKVAMYGGSYLGFSQWATAKKLHPALKTIVPQVAVGIGVDYPMQNNVFMSYMLRWIHYVVNNKLVDRTDFGNTERWDSVFSQWYKGGRSFRSLDTIEGRPNDIFQRWLKHPSHDNYWQNMVAYQKDFAGINIPILSTTGYYDDDQLGAMYYFRQHHLHNKNANHYLLIGPYDHGGAQSTPVSELNGYKIDSVANIVITDLAFQWFDHILKGKSLPPILKDKINYQVMGTNQWHHAPSLEKVSNDSLVFYLSNIRVGNHYKLLLKKPVTKEYIRQELDYMDRENPQNQFAMFAITDSIRVNNHLSFISEPFDAPVQYTGAFSGEIMTMLNKKDMDISIIVYEMLPDGRYFLLSTFLGRASYVKDRSKRNLLVPGKMEKIAFNETFFTSRQLQKGSRLMIMLGINKDQNWQVNYGTGKDVSDETIQDGKVPLDVKWFNDSFIKIPIKR